ncbi:MAG: transporter [Parvularculaceae bacterium]
MFRQFGLTAVAAFAATQGAFAQEEPPICTDRPTKANSYCTVPAGAFQIEMDAYNYTRNTVAGVRSTTALYTNPTIKFGLTDRSDIEVNWAPHVVSKVNPPGSRQSGVGDLYVRYKHRISKGGAKVGFSLIPFVKIRTAPLGIGNNEWEGGVAAPISTGLPHGFTLTFGPELDILSEADGTGRRMNIINLVNVSRTFGKLTAYAEFWAANDILEEGSFDQRSVDFAVTYLIAPKLQIDAGVNLGVNPNTPDVQAYAGISYRF